MSDAAGDRAPGQVEPSRMLVLPSVALVTLSLIMQVVCAGLEGSTLFTSKLSWGQSTGV